MNDEPLFSLRREVKRIPSPQPSPAGGEGIQPLPTLFFSPWKGEIREGVHTTASYLILLPIEGKLKIGESEEMQGKRKEESKGEGVKTPDEEQREVESILSIPIW